MQLNVAFGLDIVPESERGVGNAITASIFRPVDDAICALQELSDVGRCSLHHSACCPTLGGNFFPGARDIIIFCEIFNLGPGQISTNVRMLIAKL